MDIDAPVESCAQERRRQDATICDDDRRVRLMRTEKIERLFVPDFSWLMNCQIMFEGEFFDWRLGEFITAPGWTVRLRPDSDDLVTIIEAAPQSRHSRKRGAHED
jgi:hypothetical protein